MVQSIEFAPAVRRQPFQLGKQVTLFILLMFFYLLGCAGEIHAKWYRYYDSRGTANISANVTPAHIRYGYESLDQNMQVIAKTPAWNGDRDAKTQARYESQARQQQYDLKLKRAYGNSKIATMKRDESLNSIKKQIAFQQEQLKQQQNDRVMYKNQENQYIRKGQNIPVSVREHMLQNQQQILNSKAMLKQMQDNYNSTQIHYADVIARLKKME